MKVNGVVKAWRWPESSERQLARELQRAVRDLVVMMRDSVKPMKFDAEDEEITQAEIAASNFADQLIASLVALLPALAMQMYRFNSRQWLAIAKSSGGRANPAVMLLDLTGPTASEPWYQETENQWLSLTRTSIDKLFSNIVSDWSTRLRTLAMQEKKTAQVKEDLSKRYETYKSWAANRASGIVGTWQSKLMRQRLKDAGVSSYIWRGMMDSREREKHVLLEGKKIPLNSTHIFPGEEYNCRCWAIPHWGQGEFNEARTAIRQRQN